MCVCATVCIDDVAGPLLAASGARAAGCRVRSFKDFREFTYFGSKFCSFSQSFVSSFTPFAASHVCLKYFLSAIFTISFRRTQRHSILLWHAADHPAHCHKLRKFGRLVCCLTAYRSSPVADVMNVKCANLGIIFLLYAWVFLPFVHVVF